MSEKNMYSPKEVAAFDGLFRLAGSGRRFSAIKVQDIATAAGIGKGTLYEYFSSKEEILARAILYAMDRIMDWLEQQMQGEVSLFRTMETFLKELQDERLLPFSALTSLSSIVPEEQKKLFGQQYHDEMFRMFVRMQKCERELFEAARRNGEIDPQLDDSYCEYVIVSALFGIAGRKICAHQQGAEMQWDLFREMVYRALRPLNDIKS